MDQCDTESGTCVHEPLRDDRSCLTLEAGNTLSSIYALPEEDASVEAVFGESAEALNWFSSEGVGAYRLSDSTLVGNYRELEPWRA